jgi:uncharacterized protein YkwD
MRLRWLPLCAAFWLPSIAAAQVAENSHWESTVALTPQPDRQQEPREELAAVAEQIITQSQAFRQQQHVGAVEVDPQLMETAQYFAQYMAKTNQYGHQADGQRPSQRAKAHGYDYCIVSENIGYVFSSQPLTDEALAQEFVDGWKRSPEHRQNMLAPDVTQIGAAVAQSADSGYSFAVQMFGRPESAATRFELVNETSAVLRYRIGERTLELPPRYTRLHKRCQTGPITLVTPDAAPSAAAPSDAAEPTAADSAPISFVPQPGERLVVVEGADGRLELQRGQADQPRSLPKNHTGQPRSDKGEFQ